MVSGAPTLPSQTVRCMSTILPTHFQAGPLPCDGPTAAMTSMPPVTTKPKIILYIIYLGPVCPPFFFGFEPSK